ncbi:hypothetical protein SK128_009908, partial [Halocaridina rubra]
LVLGQYVSVEGDVISHVNVSSVAALDGGLYRCTATNSVGSVSHGARLNVYVFERIEEGRSRHFQFAAFPESKETVKISEKTLCRKLRQ